MAEQISLEAILSLMSASELEITVFADKIERKKMYRNLSLHSATADEITSFDVNTIPSTVREIYYARVQRGDWRGGNTYYWNVSQSKVSLEKAIRNVWKRYLNDMVLRNARG